MIRRRAFTAEPDRPAPMGFDDFELRLGDVMRGERATLGKSLLDVQRELKIKATYVAAIENCDPTAFETTGFIAGYVRSYARYLGMDPDKAYEAFCEEADFRPYDRISSDAARAKSGRKPARAEGHDPLADPNASFVPRGEALFTGVEPGALGSVAILIVLISLLGLGGWKVLEQIQQVEVASTTEDTGLLSASLDPLDAARSRTALASAMPSDEAEARMRSSEALDRLYRPEALDVPVLEPRDGPIAAVNPAELGAFAQPARPVAEKVEADQSRLVQIEEPEIQVVEPPAPELVIVAARPAWVRLQGAGGTVLLEKVLDAGEEYVLPQTEEPPMLRVGESGAIYFAVNGTHYGPAGPDGTVTSNIALDPDQLSERYSVADLASDQDLARMVAEARTTTIEAE